MVDSFVISWIGVYWSVRTALIEKCLRIPLAVDRLGRVIDVLQ